MFCRKSSGMPSTGRSEYSARIARDSSLVRKEFIRTSGSATSYSLRVARICRAMMSRKLRPSLTGSADLGPVTPIEVPRPPFNLITTVSARAARIDSSSVSRCSR
jgi:hypothetical protein